MTTPRRKGARKTPRNSPAAAYQAGVAAFERGRYAEAVELLSGIADERNLPGTLGRFYLGQAHQRVGIGELRLGRCASAARHLTAARQVNPGSADLSRFLLACHVGRGRFDLAVAEIEKTQNEGLGGGATPIRLAHALVGDGQYDRGVATLENAIREAPHRADLRLQLGLLHAAVEEYDDAVKVLDDAARLAPLDAAVRQHLGLALAARGEAAAAVEHLAVAQKLQPHDAYVALLLTLAVQAAQSAAAADGPVRAGGGASACGSETRIGEGEVNVDPAPVEATPADDAAIGTLGNVIVQDPDFVEAFLSLPESDVDPEIFATLAAILERALEHHPDYADLHYHCCRVYARLGRTESAISEGDRAVEINPRYVQALIQLGRLHTKTDRFAEAIDRLQAAIESGGDYPDVHFMLGGLYRGGGETDRARGEYRRALALNANYVCARDALEALASG